MIRNIQLRHAGKYTCAVQTKVDSSSIATDLIVRGKKLIKRGMHHILKKKNTPPLHIFG